MSGGPHAGEGRRRRIRSSVALFAAVTLAPLAVATAEARSCGDSPFAAAGVPRQPSSGAWAIDLRTGCEWGWGQTDRRYPMASTAKVAVLSLALDRVATGALAAAAVDALARSMIERSDNAAATELWRLVGGSAAVDAHLRSLGLRQVAPWPTFGGVAMTPHDLAWLANRVVGAASALPDALRDYARSPMTSVVRDQRFGVSAGVPAGWSVALKDGWFLIRPIDRGVAGRWRVHSVGVVFSPQGRPAWALGVMGDEWPTMAAGVAEIERVSRAVAGALAR